MSNGKATIIPVTVGLIKKTLLCKMSYLPELYSHKKHEINVELDLFNCAAEADLKGGTSSVHQNFLKADFASFKRKYW